MKHSSGFGLTEILVSLFLSSIIMTSLIQLYLTIKRHYLESQKVLEMQLEIQWVSDLLTDSIRRAGFTPCLSIERLISIDMRHSGRTLKGLKWLSDSRQSLQIHRMNEIFSEGISFRSPTEIVVTSPVVFNTNRPLIIADCYHAEVHQIQAVDKLANGQIITLVRPVRYSYDQSAFVGEWIEEEWMIKANTYGMNTLHYHSVQAEELSPLIHSLSVSSELLDGKQYIKIQMGLEQNKSHELTVLVRGS